MKTKIWMLAALLMLALGQVSAAEKITYYHLDALGSPIAATDESGNLAWKEAYKPYGERIRKEDGGSNSQWYTGKQEDEDNGLTYFGARWYDPAIGRFMGIDPVGVQEDNIHSFNRFAYANNNPYTFVDPDGRSPAFVDAYLVENAQATSMGYDIYTRAGAQAVRDLGVDNAILQAEVISLMGGGAGALGLKGLGKGVTKSAPIRGNAQVTRKAGSETTHASTSQRIANQEALRTNAQSVHLNQQIGTITNGQIKSRVRPDVATVRSDGKIDAFEVLSPGQTVQQQTRKLQNALGNRAGNITCVACD